MKRIRVPKLILNLAVLDDWVLPTPEQLYKQQMEWIYSSMDDIQEIRP